MIWSSVTLQFDGSKGTIRGHLFEAENEGVSLKYSKEHAGHLNCYPENGGMNYKMTGPIFIHSFIQANSIAPYQVHYYSEALPTQHG